MFLKDHILSFLSQQEKSKLPVDQAFRDYTRLYKQLGARDRRYMAEQIFGYVRWKELLQFAYPGSKERQLAALAEVGQLRQNQAIPPHLRAGMTRDLYEMLPADLREKVGDWISQEAPIAIRVNRMKGDVETFLSLAKSEGWTLFPSEYVADALYLTKREPLFASSLFKEGWFEVQDEGSQMMAALVEATPKSHVLDYCAGSGGKALAIAPLMKGTGQLYLHDIRQGALQEAAKRLRRAGVQNGQIAFGPSLKKLQGKIDFVLVDAPCSGSGTLRRNVDLKWKIDRPMVERLISQQRQIVKEAIPFVKKGGRLIYVTCSLLAEENERQVEFFQREYGLLLDKTASTATLGRMDAFFGARFAF